MDTFLYNISTAGANHVSAGKVCQDRSAAISYRPSDGPAADVLIVSDGHGNPEHFRSDTGAQFAVDSVADALPYIVPLLAQELPATTSPVCRGVADGSVHADSDRTPADSGFETRARMFFMRLTALWAAKVLGHSRAFPLENNGAQPVAKAYGCTLIGAICLPDRWFAFQLGDGACVIVDGGGSVLAPIPADSRCSMNRTTSLCAHGAADFRYAYGTGALPAIMLCSDGVADCFDSVTDMGSLVMERTAAALAGEGPVAVDADMRRSLPELSRLYSGDDMSLAMLIRPEDMSGLMEGLRCRNMARTIEDVVMTHRELRNTDKSIAQIEDAISSIMRRLAVNPDYDLQGQMERDKASLRTLQRQRNELLERFDDLSLEIENFD